LEVEEDLVEEVLNEEEQVSDESSRPSTPAGNIRIYQQTERPLLTGSLKTNRTQSMKNEFIGPQSMSLRSTRPPTHRTVSASSTAEQTTLMPETKIVKQLSTSSFLSQE
jgi:hypothetical protein